MFFFKAFYSVSITYFISSGGTRIFLWGIEGAKCVSEGAKNKKECQKWLIFAIFFFWLEGQVGAESPTGGANVPSRPPLVPPLFISETEMEIEDE